MRVARLSIENFRGIRKAELHFSGHTLLIGANNVGKSTICEALDLVLGPDRLSRMPPVEEFDFRNANYLNADGETVNPIRVEAILVDLTDDMKTLCAVNLEFWHKVDQRLLAEGEIAAADDPNVEFCLRLVTLAQYDVDEDQFVARTVYGRSADDSDAGPRPIPARVKRAIGFLYLRTIRTGSRALSLERGTLLDNILRMKEARKGMWEGIRRRLASINPPIDADVTELGPILDEIEARLAEYIAPAGVGRLRHHGWEGRLAPRLRPAGLVADADEERRHVLAVLAALGEGGAGAVALDAVGRELDRHGVRLGVGGAHGAARAHVVDLDVLDDAAAEVLQAAEEGARAEQPAEAAVAQGG